MLMNRIKAGKKKTDEIIERKIPNSKSIKLNISKIMKQRSVEKKYDDFYGLVQHSLNDLFLNKNPELAEQEKQLSYEDMKKELATLKNITEIATEDTQLFLDKIIEMSCAPFDYSKDEKKSLKEKEEQLKQLAGEFVGLWKQRV